VTNKSRHQPAMLTAYHISRATQYFYAYLVRDDRFSAMVAVITTCMERRDASTRKILRPEDEDETGSEVAVTFASFSSSKVFDIICTFAPAK